MEGGKKELAITVAMWVPATVEEVFTLAREGRMLEASRDVLEVIDIGAGKAAEDAFARVGYAPNEAKELTALGKVKPGNKFNLDTDEISRIQKAAKGGGDKAKAVTQAYRDILLDRYRAYLNGGVANIAPYARARGKFSTPASELKTAVSREQIFQRRTPEFYSAYVNFPRAGQADIENQFLCIKQDIQDRPTIILSHRMFQVRPDYAVAAERQFYVGQSYNSLHIMIGCSALNDGTVMFYRNRTSTDQVAGFGGAAKRGIRRAMMKNKIVEKFEEVREKLFP